MSSNLFQAALRFSGRGWPVMPCRPGEKVPATQNGLKDATTDWGQVIAWWSKVPTCNVAVCTGAEAGFVVLDVDGEEGVESLRALEKEHGALPRTASVVTPSGGQHYYFKHPGGEFRNSAGKLGTGLDIRGDGGYVLAPPSRVKGRPYEVDERAPMAEVPGWLQEASQRHQQPGEAQPTSVWMEIMRHGVQEGGRNHGMASLVGHFLRRYIDLDLTREVAHLVNQMRFKPPLPDWEVNRTVDSVNESELRRREANDANR